MSRIAFDAHAHIYPCYDLSRLFACALAVARRSGGSFHLLLTEGSGQRFFASFRDAAEEAGSRSSGAAPSPPGPAPGLHWELTQEPQSLCARSTGDGAAVYLIAGRQFVSLERIEVLVLGLAPDAPLYERLDFRDPATVLLHQGLEAGAAICLPWSPGKWVGSRGRRVEELVSIPTLAGDPLFFLGDIRARAWPWPRPAAFGGRSRVLCGTDTLPLAGAERGIGDYYSEVPGVTDPDRPWGHLLEILRGGSEVREAGRRSGIAASLLDQIRLRLRGASASPGVGER